MEASKDNAVPQRPTAAEERAGRELLLLVDEFEQFVDQRPRVPLTGKLMMDEDDVYGFIDHLRRLVPAEIRRALEVLEQRDRIISRAEAEADNLVAEARQYAERLTDASAITQQAEEEAGRILASAREEARELRQDADAYAEGLLERLEESLTKVLTQIQHGRAYLRQPRRDDEVGAQPAGGMEASAAAPRSQQGGE